MQFTSFKRVFPRIFNHRFFRLISTPFCTTIKGGVMSSPPSSSISFPRTEEDEMEVEDNDSLSKFNLIGEACVPNFPGQNELSFLSSPGDISNFSFEPPVTSSPRKRLHNDTSRHDQDGNESDVSSTSIHSSSSVLIHKDEPPVEPFKTKMTRMVCWMLFFSVLGCMPVLLISLVVPILNIFATPTFLIFILLLVFDIAFLAYLSLAQTDPPSRVTLPFLPWDFRLAIKVNLAILSWVGVAIKLVPALLGDWAVRRVIAARHGNEPRNWVRKDIHYGSLRAGKRLDVYRALPQPDDPILSSNASEITDQYSPDGLTPVIIFIHSPHLGPLRGRKWMYDSLGRNLSSLGYCVVIPDITYYPQGRTEQMVDDIRRVMKWTAENIRRYGGDIERIYLMGHSLGGHLALLTILQEAVVISRDSLLANDPSHDISNGLRKIKMYARQVEVPKIQGLILFAPISDVNEQIIHEGERGVAHISQLRRIIGPSHTTAMFHSPAHVLHASRDVVNIGLLPPRVLIVHGGFDDEVPHLQSEQMKELLRGVGMVDTRLRVYPIGHTEIITALMMRMDQPSSPFILDELQAFIPL